MKKQLLLSTALLCSFLARADNPIEELTAQFENGDINSKEINKVSQVLKRDIEKTADCTDEIIITFRVEKGEHHSKKAWEKIVSVSADLIERSEALTDPAAPDEIMIAQDISDFIKTCLKFSGDENDIHGDYSIELHTPENYTQINYTN